jgi:hypothetical protein
MARLLSCLLLILSLAACAAVSQDLQGQADPRRHPFNSYGSGGGGSR